MVLADPAGPSSVRAVHRDAASVLGTLVHARKKAEVALSAFPVGSELRSGPAASEGFLKAANLEGVSLLHLATHGLVDVDDPERSAVVLAPGGPMEDGRLEPREIARLGLGGRTVVLAACETSAGAVYRGEGVMSLARAFFGAGATAVVGTLDRTRDDEAGRSSRRCTGGWGAGRRWETQWRARSGRRSGPGPLQLPGPPWCSSAMRGCDPGGGSGETRSAGPGGTGPRCSRGVGRPPHPGPPARVRENRAVERSWSGEET
jgi:hypothetical protein